MNMDESMDLLLFLFLNRERTEIIKMDSNQSQVSNKMIFVPVNVFFSI